MLLELAPGFVVSMRSQMPEQPQARGQWEHGAVIVVTEIHDEPAVADGVFKAAPRVAPMMTEEHVMCAPQRRERRYRKDELRPWSDQFDIGPHQSRVVRHMFDDVERQDQVGVALRDRATEFNRLAAMKLIPVARITDVDACRARGIRALQKLS
jgi:hypothetical protein